jgi:L-alanine-DL-glutamate epimerase-like enolase superfamily enzyme
VLSTSHAEKFAQATELEDILRPDSVQTMAAFRLHSPVPIAVSEMLTTADQYRQVLEAGAADYVMIDPTWVGGIS